MWAPVARAVVIVALLTVVTTPAAGAKPVATLGGRTIPVDQTADLDCHDFEYPVIRCFDSVASLEADVAVQLTNQNARASFAAETVGYVVVYEHAAYAGATKILLSDVPWLSDIGWNDKISSFKSFGASGRFYEHSPSGGFIWSYGPTSRVASLNGTYNDKFSSFYID